jgi:uncharacterized protein (DUF362 family)
MATTIRTDAVGSYAAVARDETLSPTALLAEALRQSLLWEQLKAVRSAIPASAEFTVAIKPDMGALRAGSPTATDPDLVESLIDALHDQGYSNVIVTASRDTSSTFCDNRSVLALADLLGYHFCTPKGREYEIVEESSEIIVPSPRPGYVLGQEDVIDGWREAQFRIVFAKNKTDEADGYSLCLDSLFTVLALADKDYFYRHRMAAEEVLLEILELAPPHFAIIDAITSAHGSGGTRSPVECNTNTIIASSNVVLADYLGALKMGLDPATSRLFARVTRDTGPPHSYHLAGDTQPYPEWTNVHPLIIDSTRRRDRWVDIARNVQPWLQEVDPELFPLRELVDVKCNEVVEPLFRNIDTDPAAFALLTALNYGLDSVASAVYSYAVMFAKDSIRRVHVQLNVDPRQFDETAYESLPRELSELERVLAGIPQSDDIRWRYVGEAVVFEAATVIPIAYDSFTAVVDITKTIQYMNDYLGGNAVVIAKDDRGRTTRQIERNVYLPQPNYLALYGADPIDVTKLETADYEANQSRMYWKTVRSENASAQFDDGIVTFARRDDGTEISILGRQLFALPPLVQMFHLELNPKLRSSLVLEAYRSFFQRTFANLEAVAEGRDVRIGREWLLPATSTEGEPRLASWIEQVVKEYGDELSSLFSTKQHLAPQPHVIDEHGFRHFRPSDPEPITPGSQTLAKITGELSAWWVDLAEAYQKDMRWQLARLAKAE